MATTVTCDHCEGEAKAVWVIRTRKIEGSIVTTVHSTDVCANAECLSAAVLDATTKGRRKAAHQFQDVVLEPR